MINFVIYEDKKIIRDNYVNLIHRFMGNNDTSYKIYQFSVYNDELKELISKNVGYNIYLLDIEVPGKSGLDLAREIRNSGDIDSQLIIVTAHKELLDNNFTNRSLVLNFVSKYDNCEENLIRALSDAYINITRHRAFVFKNDGILYRIPYDDILYFAVDSDTGIVFLHTKYEKIPIRKSITNILEVLKDTRFMKSHKSCIINLYNITRVDLINLVIYFGKNEFTYLFSRNYKKELQQRIIIHDTEV